MRLGFLPLSFGVGASVEFNKLGFYLGRGFNLGGIGINEQAHGDVGRLQSLHHLAHAV